MIRRNSFISQFVSGALSVILPLTMLPPYALADDGQNSTPTPAKVEEAKIQPSRKLAPEELKNLRGRLNDLFDANPYVAGTNKWDVVHNGMNLITGNFTTSATDLSFEGGHGIPVNLTRSYSANNPDEGPFGIGWTISVDIRSTAGGLLKSSGAPMRSVPVNFKERPATQDDPATTATEPVEAVVTTDAAGKETTVQRDVDGILTTPPWDKNEYDSEYEMIVDGGTTYEILVSNKTRTPEGTIYEYTKQGVSTGQWAYNNTNSSATSTPSNILKISKATDRHGNETNYFYNTGTGTANQATFQKYNGNTTEQKLNRILMPGGRQIRFLWGDGTSETENTPTNRIWKAYDGDTVGASERVVRYNYTSGQLTSTWTPEGRQTQYEYGSIESGGPQTVQTTDGISVLKSITDCRGLETEISYVISNNVRVLPYQSVTVRAIVAYQVKLPNNVCTLLNLFESTWSISSSNFRGADHGRTTFCDRVGGSGGALIRDGRVMPAAGSGDTLRINAGSGMGHPDNFQAFWYKEYNTETYNCVKEYRALEVGPIDSGSGGLEDPGGSKYRRFSVGSFELQTLITETSYNCFGAPLSKTVEEDAYGTTNDRETNIDYAYWGAEKYYQQRAVRSPKEGGGYRYSFTDYYKDDAADGSKGQTKRIWGPNTFGTPYDTNETCPAGTASGDEWKYDTYPANYTYTDSLADSDCSAEFAYDSDGRQTDVWKIPAAGPNGTYIQTKTGYSGGEFGLPYEVTEAYGTGNARTTTTDDYDSIGRATVVTDALNREYTTTYNDDGQVLEVEKTDGPGDESVLVTYSYGTSGISNGMVASIKDELSGYALDISYLSSGSGTGQLDQVTEFVFVGVYGSQLDSVKYSYNDAGERETALYTTPSGDTKWRYGDYVMVGFVGDQKRAFQTVNKQQYVGSAWIDSGEEFHYNFDATGRLTHAAYGQTPDAYTGWTPGTSGVWYSTGHVAERRLLTENFYDAASRVLSTKSGKQIQVPGSEGEWSGWTSTVIYENNCTYSDDLGMKISSQNIHKDASGSSVKSWTEEYDYDLQLDYVIEADHNDSISNELQTWTYDYAGNRSNSGYTYDNLNRMTASPGMTYINDAVGNRIARNYTPGQSGQPNSNARMYNWDVLNRMTATAGAVSGTGYRNIFRADGMRVQKIDDIDLEFTENPNVDDGSGFYDAITVVDKPTTRYFYDGQMCFEDELTEMIDDAPRITTSKYGLGARGIDFIEKKVGSGSPTVGFPVYDAHGNMVMTISRTTSSPWFADGLHRGYDVWGSMRWNPSSSSEIKTRYVANLGHVEDDESGLHYMRARFYEPWTGRFVSEDPSMDGTNWYIYASNNAILNADFTGRTSVLVILEMLLKWLNGISNSDSVISAGSGIGALIRFASEIAFAESSLEVEESWARFMLSWSYSPIDSIEPSGTLGLLIGVISILSGYVTTWPVGHGNAITASSIVTKFYTLSMAYSLRISWYIDDIDK